MPDPNRLADLQRQRTLIAEHLAWLDREISRESMAHPSTVRPSEPTAMKTTAATEPERPVLPIADRNDVAAEQHADELLDRYRVSSTDVQQDVRKGCLIYFGAAFAVLALIIAVLAWAFRQ